MLLSRATMFPSYWISDIAVINGLMLGLHPLVTVMVVWKKFINYVQDDRLCLIIAEMLSKAAQKPVSNLDVTISLHGVFCALILPPSDQRHNYFHHHGVSNSILSRPLRKYFTLFEEVQVHELCSAATIWIFLVYCPTQWDVSFLTSQNIRQGMC